MALPVPLLAVGHPAQFDRVPERLPSDPEDLRDLAARVERLLGEPLVGADRRW